MDSGYRIDSRGPEQITMKHGHAVRPLASNKPQPAEMVSGDGAFSKSTHHQIQHLKLNYRVDKTNKQTNNRTIRQLSVFQRVPKLAHCSGRMTKADTKFKFAQIQSIVYLVLHFADKVANIWIEDLGSGTHQGPVTYD